jgi:hypothetical protein
MLEWQDQYWTSQFRIIILNRDHIQLPMLTEIRVQNTDRKESTLITQIETFTIINGQILRLNLHLLDTLKVFIWQDYVCTNASISQLKPTGCIQTKWSNSSVLTILTDIMTLLLIKVYQVWTSILSYLMIRMVATYHGIAILAYFSCFHC